MLDKSLFTLANAIIILFMIYCFFINGDLKYTRYKSVFLIICFCGLYYLIKYDKLSSILFFEQNCNCLDPFDKKNKNKNSTMLLPIFAPHVDKIIWWINDIHFANRNLTDLSDIGQLEYMTSGIANVQKDNYAYITVPCLRQIDNNIKKVPIHLHYREQYDNMLNEVKTINVDC